MHKVGDLVAVVRFCKVSTVSPKGDGVTVKDIDDGLEFDINGQDMLKSLKSASEFSKQEKKSLTELATIVSQAFNKPITVCFDKADGSERTMIGRITSAEPLLGRSYMEDSEITTGHRLRQVDHRTVKWAIVDGVKYSLKGADSPKIAKKT
jgi:hypothetical protein